MRDSFPSYAFDTYPDASGVHLAGNPMSRGGGVYLETGHFKRVVWPSNEFWRKAFGTNTMFLEAVAALHGFLVALKLNGRRAYRLHVDNAGVVAVFKKYTMWLYLDCIKSPTGSVS